MLLCYQKKGFNEDAYITIANKKKQHFKAECAPQVEFPPC